MPRSGILPLHQLGETAIIATEKQQLENDLTDLIIRLLISEPLSVDEYIYDY